MAALDSATSGCLRTLCQALWQRPLLRFLLYGVALYLAISYVTVPAPEPLLMAGQGEQLRVNWIRQTGREPDERVLRLLLRQAVNEELLFRSAIDQGMHLIDPLVRRRLVRNMRFLGEEAEAGALLRKAFRMGMQLQDQVVRRRLLQLMEFGARAQVATIGEEELRTYYAERSDALRSRRISFEHRFFSNEKRGEDAAEQLARQLATQCAVTEQLPSDGDVFDAGESFVAQSRAKIGKHFGFAFADVLLRAEAGSCLGPVPSSYGQHVVWLSASVEQMPAFATVRALLHEELMERRTRQQLQRLVGELRERHPMTTQDLSY